MSKKPLVIVESPSKARTLSKFLGSDYNVLSSYGHVSDLPKNKLGFDADNDFKAEFILSKDKYKVVKDIKSNIDNDNLVYLATDDDREGYAIAKHLIDILKLPKERIRRTVFHEITKGAILHALANPIEMNYKLADAAIARRILDRAVGYRLSPLLWKKIKFGLSAGRVQSVAVRIVVDKEREISTFIPDEFWKLKLDILSNPSFKAELSKHDNKIIKVSNVNEATHIKNMCDKSDYILSDVNEKDSFRNPPPPFTTSTLQQEASTKAGLSPKLTMMLAQKLYEGSIHVPGHTGGLITYMRTDSLNLSEVALKDAKEVILKEYGLEYTLNTPRKYAAKGGKVVAQEAHEAVRPVDMSIKPSDLSSYLDGKELKLYTLIWQRTLATQMQQAKVANTTYKIHGGEDRSYEFVAKGTKILFPGFMKAYTEGNDDPDNALDSKEKFLPNVKVGTVFKETELTTEQNFTKPPARYSEASLIKKLESEGIGRPSTYATTLGTILAREYVTINLDKRLEPTLMGGVVTEYLIKNFPNIVDLAFTANIETDFDKIADGEIRWQDVMKSFYGDFDKNVSDKEGGDRVQFSEDINLGIDPKSKLTIYVKTGQYGSYIQLGEKDPENVVKPKISPIPKGVKHTDVTLEMALEYLRLPRTLGKDEDGSDVIVNIGRFGPVLSCESKYYGLDKEVDVYSITLGEALTIIKEQKEKKAKSLLWEDSSKGIKILKGPYGNYITKGVGKAKKNFKLPKELNDDEIRKLTLAKVEEIIKNQPVRTGKPFKGKKR